MNKLHVLAIGACTYTSVMVVKQVCLLFHHTGAGAGTLVGGAVFVGMVLFSDRFKKR